MTAPLVLSILLDVLALVFTLSVLLLVLWQHTYTSSGWALAQYLGSLALLQGSTFVAHFGLMADFPDFLVEGLVHLTIIGFALTMLTSLALVLHMAHRMQEAWIVICRSGVAGLVVLQPVLWQHGLLRLPDPLDEHLFGSPYTSTGQVLVIVGAAYLVLTVATTWHYRRRIDALVVIVAVIGVAVAQFATMTVGTLRELSLAAIVGGVFSGMLGYDLIRQAQLTPRSSWLRTLHDATQAITRQQSVEQVLSHIAERTRLLIGTDTVSVLTAVDADRLQVTAMAGQHSAILGRYMQAGDGLAGRVMQTRQPMRISSYQTWDGRAADFETLPYYASMSVPLVYQDELVGVLNVHESTPERVFNNHDQMILELLAPQVAAAIGQFRLSSELDTIQQFLDALMTHTPAAVFLFGKDGHLRQANATAHHHLQAIAGDAAALTASELAAQAQDNRLTLALAGDMTEPLTLDTSYPALGQVSVSLYPLGDAPDVLWIMQGTAT
jgi:putative methionine-R-sulfoxide reductase with GAF domain